MSHGRRLFVVDTKSVAVAGKRFVSIIVVVEDQIKEFVVATLRAVAVDQWFGPRVVARPESPVDEL